MHTIKINNKSLMTDLLIDQENQKKYISKETIIDGIKIINSKDNSYKYTTIYYNDITDKDNYKRLEKVLVNELKKYLKQTRKETTLIVGLGNRNSTPDSLGPKTIDNILVTRYLFLLGEVEEGYSNVCTFIPNVMGNTGIETANIVKSIIQETKATKVIIIDSLKTTNLNRLNKTIQITNKGISPGSGIYNNRQEISKKTMNIDVIAIGVPTVVELNNLLEKQYKEKLIVTPTNIDFIIEKLAILIGNGINISLHKNFIRQNNN